MKYAAVNIPFQIKKGLTLVSLRKKEHSRKTAQIRQAAAFVFCEPGLAKPEQESVRIQKHKRNAYRNGNQLGWSITCQKKFSGDSQKLSSKTPVINPEEIFS